MPTTPKTGPRACSGPPFQRWRLRVRRIGPKEEFRKCGIATTSISISNGWKKSTCYFFGNPSPLTYTNSIENLWSLFKVGVVGQFHEGSEKHLGRYLEEFTYRFNGWEDHGLFENTLRNLVNGKVLPLEKLMKAA